MEQICPNCQKFNPANYNYCGGCGERLGGDGAPLHVFPVCSRCSKPMNILEQYCGQCGNPINPQNPDPPGKLKKAA